MSNDTIIQGVADLDISPFIAKLSQLTARVDAAATQVTASLQRMGAALYTSVAGTQTGLAGIGPSLGKTAGDANKVGDALERTGKRAKQSIDDMVPGLDKWQAQLKAVEDKYNSIYRAGAQISQVAMTMGFLGAAILGVEAASIKSASGVDFWTKKAIAAAQAAGNFMGGNAQLQKQAMQDLPDMIRNVAVETGQSADRIAESFARWQQATGAQIKTLGQLWNQVKQVETIIKATVIANMDEVTAVKGVIQILGAYGMKTSDAAQVTMLLSNAAQVTNAEFGDFIESGKMTAAAAARLGIPLEELIGTLGSLSFVGQKGTQAGRGLQQVLQQLVDPSKEANGVLQEVLVNMQGLTGSWRDIVFPGGEFVGLMDKVTETGERHLGLFGLLATATDKLTTSERERFNAIITTQNAYRVLSPLIQAYKQGVIAASQAAISGVGAEVMSLEDLVKVLKNANGVQQSFKEQWDTVSAAIEIQWGQQIQRLATAFAHLGTEANGALLPLVKGIGDVVIGLRAWALENPKLFSQIVTIGTVLAALMVTLGTFGFLIGQMLQGFTAVWAVLSSSGGAAFKILGGTLSSVSLALAGLTLAAIVLVNVWRTNFLGLQPVLQGIADVLKNTLGAALVIISDLVKLVGALFNGEWQAAWDTFLDIVVTVLALLKVAFDRVLVEVYKWGVNIAGQLARGLWDGANAVLTGVLTGIANLIAGFFRGASPPRLGPLSTIDKWGEGVMSAYARGILSGAEKHIKPAATEAAKMMSKPLEGHSPAKEGPLTEIGQWGTNLMDALLRGFAKADFSIINDAVSLVSTYLRQQLDDKKISASSFLGNVGEIRSTLVGLMDTLRKGGEIAADAFRRVKEIVGGIGDDVENVVNAYAEVLSAQEKVDSLKEKQDTLKEQKYTDYDLPKKALDDQNKSLELQKWQWEQLKQSIDDAKEKLERQKYPWEDIIEKTRENIKDLQERVRAIDDGTGPIESQIALLEKQGDLAKGIASAVGSHALEDFKTALNDLKVPIQETIQGIQDEIDKHRAAADVVRERISDLKDEKGEIEDQIKIIEHRYDKERDVARDAISLLREQLDAVRMVNKEKMRPLEDKAKSADAALDSKRRQDKKEEEVIERKIAEYRSRGVAEYYIRKLEDQLRKIKDSHDDEESILDDAKRAAQDALEAAKAKAQIEEDSIQKQINLKELAEKALERTQNALIEKETVNLKKRVETIDKDVKVQEKEAKILEKDIEAHQLRIKTEQSKEKNLDKQIAAIDKELRVHQKKTDALQHEITVEERKERTAQKQLDIIEKNIKWFERRGKVYEDEIKSLGRQEQANSHEAALLEQKRKTLLDAIATNDHELEVTNKVLKKAQERLEIEQAIADLHERERKDAETAAKAAKGTDGFGTGEESDLKPKKTLDEYLEEFRDRLKKQLGLLSADLEEEKKKIRRQLEELFAFTLPGFDWAKWWKYEEDRWNLNWALVQANFKRDTVNAWKWLQAAWDVEVTQNVQITTASWGKNWDLFWDGLGKGLGQWLKDRNGDWETFWKTSLPGTIDNAKGTFEKKVGEIKGVVEQRVIDLKNALVGPGGRSGLVGDIREKSHDIFGRSEDEGLRGDWKKAWAGVGTTLFGPDGKSGLVGGIRKFLVGEDGESGLIGGMIKNVKTALGDENSGLRQIFRGVFEGIKGIVNGILTPIQDVVGKIESLKKAAGDAWKWIQDHLPGGQSPNASSSSSSSGGSSSEAAWIAMGRPDWARDPTGRTDIDGNPIPSHAAGGIFTREHIARVAEGGQPEVIMKVSDWLSQLSSTTSSVRNIVDALSGLTTMQLAPTEMHNHYHIKGPVIVSDREFEWLESKLKTVRDVRVSRISPP